MRTSPPTRQMKKNSSTITPKKYPVEFDVESDVTRRLFHHRYARRSADRGVAHSRADVVPILYSVRYMRNLKLRRVNLIVP